ncbi:hypothetical protein Cs7R123_23660 [Catellatospora sp. TT07R-123]|uniref:hypothetical protein n=1 Tax=Catellatospora sp. TT07R-123 TaxID=2733863 RepID=UPI001B255EC9|nr:hypothetical protein [Catellatospora sp. TT07R-123]GHJ45024.1 hypothetical protein Cs7R123_23660 [Catellatospora sp. TT07R-123]
MDISPGTAREEAERLVAAALAAATLAANANPHLATGSAECCICPLCRVIAAVRDPDPEFVERVATGAGDLAAGLASFLRSVSTAQPGADDVWRHATHRPPGHDTPGAAASGAPEGDTPTAAAAPPVAKKVAKKIAKKVVAKQTPGVSEPETPVTSERVKPAKKAVRKATPHPPAEL